MTITFPRPLANSANFPKAEVRVNPSLVTAVARLSFLRRGQPALFDGVAFTKSGRAALGIAARELGIAPGDRVLLPAYHCPAMVEPFMWSGAVIEFYRVQTDLSVDLDDLANKLPNAKACVLVRYFGFPQNLRDAAERCRARNVVVIEDCAHSFFSLDHERGLDPASEVAIFSLNKFFPTVDGGAVRFLRRDFTRPMHGQPMLSEARAMFRPLGISNPLPRLTRMLSTRSAPQQSCAARDANGFRYFDPDELSVECFRHTKWLVKYGDLRRIAEERRSNFRFLLERLTDSPIGAPVFKTLPDSVVPYVFPFLLRDEADFNVIRRGGLEVLRWEEFAESDCAISESYRAKLIQLPCRQGLSTATLNHIVSIIQNVESNR